MIWKGRRDGEGEVWRLEAAEKGYQTQEKGHVVFNSWERKKKIRLVRKSLSSQISIFATWRNR